MQINRSNENYYKRIICDYDDTISLTTDRDWKNALPNQPVIDKINSLYDQGWEIWIYTARGNLSCFSRTEARTKYEPGIIEWLEKHGVKYHRLSFDKPIGAYYVDDKALRPDEFAALDIEQLQGGMSGARIERRGDLVYKTAPNSLEAAVWYKRADQFFNVPKIHSVIGNTICMDYIENVGDEIEISKVHPILETFRGISPLYNLPFDTYIKRIQDHLDLTDNIPSKKVTSVLESIKDECDSDRSFSHGDFTVDNIIVNWGSTYYLIDPINVEVYSSWMLDVAKLLHSLKRHGMADKYSELLNLYPELKRILKVLEMTQWIRIRKYAESDLQERVDEEVKNLLGDL